MSTTSDRLGYLLHLADSHLVIGQRLAEWIGHAPALEEELALANLSLDCIGAARLLLDLAAEVEAAGRDADALAFLRDADEYRNLSLVEQENGDFAVTIVRQLLFDDVRWVVQLFINDGAGHGAKSVGSLCFAKA